MHLPFIIYHSSFSRSERGEVCYFCAAMIIRKAVEADAEAIVGIYNYYVEETVVSFETEAVSVEQMRGRIVEIEGECPFLVGEEEGRIVGFAYAHRWKARAAYRCTAESTVYVDRRKTGRGLGRQLMERLMEECRRAGLHTLIACITYPNEPSERLHERLGFERVSFFREVGAKMGRWLSVVDYQVVL